MGAVLWTLVVVLGVSRTQAVITIPGGYCCGVNLMDSSNRPVIENVPLNVGPAPVTYRALRVHLCCTDKFYVQIWRRLYSNEDLPKRRYQLVWQKSIEGQVYMVTSVKYTLFPFNDTVELRSISGQKEFHLGLWSPGNDKHCVPYKFIKSETRMLFPSMESTAFSRQRYSDTKSLQAGMENGTIAEFDELDFPRTHAGSLNMCENENCNDVIGEEEEEPTYEHAVAGPPGQPGPPGPPGKDSPNQNPDWPYGPGCDIGETMNGDLSEIKKQNDDIKEGLDQVNSIIAELTNANIVTGICMPGAKPGTYGLGYCYFLVRDKMSYAEASIHCTDKHDAVLADIKSLSEEVYLQRLIQNEHQFEENEQYFLGAMYAPASKKWYWYDYSRSIRQPTFPYTNWNDDYSIEDMEEDYTNCLALVVEPRDGRSYWKPVSCMERLYSICKVAKKCL